nr:MAG TPA: hypothetical protein [Caudoviricetes sp.]
MYKRIKRRENKRSLSIYVLRFVGRRLLKN